MMLIQAIGANPTLLWGLTADQRLARIAAAQKLGVAPAGTTAPVLVSLSHVWDPAWLRFATERPDHVVTHGGVPVIAHVPDGRRRAMVFEAMERGEPLSNADGLTLVPQEETDLTNEQLRKRERPFMDRLVPENVRALERASYFGAYKGVTDILTKYLWPEWALVLTRIAARIGMTPNMVTAIGAALCVAAAVFFYHGWFWTGLAAALGFMVLDTVDGKLARCTITSSKWGNIFDHGIDLVHPPFWYYAWGVGLRPQEEPISDTVFWTVMAVIVAGYIAQRVIEGVFIRQFGMHIHVWQRFDSRFRLITARRNPNFVILFLSLLIGETDLGLVAVAAWTVISLLVHLVRLLQAYAVRARGGKIRSWLS